MGRDNFGASDEGNVFSLDLSSHGAQVFAKGMEAYHTNGTGCAGIDSSKLVSFCRPTTMFEFKLLEAVRKFKPVCTGSTGMDHNMLAKLLSALGYTVCVQSPAHHCNCKSKNRRCLENLGHTYLLCSGAVESLTEVDLIIEPRLREHFEIAHPTAGYTALLQAVPPEFVGSPAKLRIVVEAISAAMAEAFKAQDLSLPPWRRTAAALSKWNLDQSNLHGRSPSTSPEPQHSWGADKTDSKVSQLKGSGLQNVGFPGNNVAAQPTTASCVEDPFQKVATQTLPNGKRTGGQATGKHTVSLLARGLQDMAVLQKAKRPAEKSVAAAKLKRAPSWDFSGLPPITTVRRSGRVS